MTFLDLLIDFSIVALVYGALAVVAWFIGLWDIP